MSAALSARAVCKLLPGGEAIANGTGGVKEEVVSSEDMYASEENGRCINIRTLLKLVTVTEDLQALYDLHCSIHMGLKHDFIHRAISSQRISFGGREQRLPDGYLGVHSIDQISAKV